ncbi:SPRY domain-containing SOCS box protein 4 [Mactra antiquata]
MYGKLCAVFLFCLLQGAESVSSDGDSLGYSGTEYQALGGVLLLISMIALVALCASGSVAAGDPIPPWVYTISPDPSIDTGITGTSDGINAINNNCVHRHRKGHFETDGARWGAALSKGKHVFEIYWPMSQRGTMATVGVGNADAPLYVKPKDSLVGCNKMSWGFDITRRRLLHNGQMLGTMPRAGMVPDKFYMYVDCDGGTLGFGTDHAYWGAPINIPRQNFPVYPMIGSMCHNSQITMIYRGSENRAGAPGNINTVVVPSQGPGGQVQVTVVNPQTVKTY